jgi:hypothetical protein
MMFDGERVGAVVPQIDDSSRRRIVGMVLFVYVLLIVEGALRKWVLPEFGQVLFFVRDPFVLAIYGMALTSGHWPHRSPWLTAALLLALLSFLLAVLQVAVGLGNPQAPLIFAAYGMRNYFFYIPLAFIVAEIFQLEDLRRVAVITFGFLVLSTFLVVVQFYSPVDSPINVGTADDPLLQFRGLGLDEKHTRPMGFFTSDGGQKQLVVSALALVLAAWGGVFHRGGLLRFLLPMATLGVLACLAFSGSRGAVLSAGLVFSAAMFAAARGGTEVGRGRLFFIVAGVFLLAAVLIPLLFADGLSAFLGRWSDAQAYERTQFSGGIFGRALYGFIDFSRLLVGTPLLGFGIGMGGNAAILAAANAGGAGLQYSAETDWARHIVDLGPVLGLAFMVFRIGLVIAVTRRVLLSRSVLATLLLGYLGYELLTGQITGQGTINGYAWLFTGFTLAAAKAQQIAAAPDSPRLVEAPFPNLMR